MALLHRKKANAVAKEDYEEAIVLRDRMNELRRRLQALLGAAASEKKGNRDCGDGGGP